MKRILKLFSVMIATLALVSVSVVPALAATFYYPSGKTYYSGGFYRTRYGSYRPAQPAPTTRPVTPTNPSTPSTPPSSPGSLSAEESKMLNLVNQERTSRGIRALTVNSQLVSLARTKSADMVARNYFGHTSPVYGDPFQMMKKYGVQYKTAGENLAGASTTESAHQNLMASSGHRANILNTSFSQVGIGIAKGSPYGNIFTQMFIGL